MRRRAPLVAAMAGGLLLLAAIAVLQYRAAQQNTAASDAGSGSRFSVQLDGVERGASPAGVAPAPSGMHYVTLQVSFTNHSTSQQRADPGDFSLIDGTGARRHPMFANDAASPCARWRIADLHPAGDAGSKARDSQALQVGPTFGPRPLCFLAAGPTTHPMTLDWEPDTGFFGSTATHIAIR